MENKIMGFKAFNKGMITNFNNKLEVNKSYHIDGEIKYKKNGYHFCKNLEDTLRFVDGMNSDIDIAKVIGYGEIDETYDDYYGYYNMYSVSNINIVETLNKKEIIDEVIENGNVERLLSGLKFNDEELEYMIDNYKGLKKILLRYIEYYQKGNKDAFKRARY